LFAAGAFSSVCPVSDCDVMRLQRKPLTARLIAAVSEVVQFAPHAKSNETGRTPGQPATEAVAGRMAQGGE
jgi:hypothetical protein